MTKEAGHGDEARKPASPPESSSTPNETETELPERWSIQRKCELVLRLLRGEALDAVSRERQVLAHEFESWKRIFLEQGTRAQDAERSLGNASSRWPGPRLVNRSQMNRPSKSVPLVLDGATLTVSASQNDTLQELQSAEYVLAVDG